MQAGEDVMLFMLYDYAARLFAALISGTLLFTVTAMCAPLWSAGGITGRWWRDLARTNPGEGAVPTDGQFGLFKDDGEGPLWRAYFNDLQEAMFQGQSLADTEATEFFVYCFQTYSERARLVPVAHKRQRL